MVKKDLTVDMVKGRIKEMEKYLKTNDYCHMKEDYLWYLVLAAISEGASNPQELAKEALKTLNLDYQRGFDVTMFDTE